MWVSALAATKKRREALTFAQVHPQQVFFVPLPTSIHERNRHLTFAPAGISSANVHNTAFPSGPADAASNTPFDSPPRIFRGAKFVTTTTLRPTNSSGAYDVAIPANTCRTSSPISTKTFKSLSAPATFSADFTTPTRNSTFAKSSIPIFAGTAGAVPTAVAAAAAPAPAAAGAAPSTGVPPPGAPAGIAAAPATEVPVLVPSATFFVVVVDASGCVLAGFRISFSIVSILSSASFLSMRGNTPSGFPIFVPDFNSPHFN